MVHKIRKKTTLRLALIGFVCFLILLVGVVATHNANSKSSSSQTSSLNVERRGLVTRVIDGDTIVIDNKTHIRLVGVNTPELHPTPELDALEAKQFMEEQCLGKKVGLDVDDAKPKDKYGRTLAVVYIDNDGSWVNINAELLHRGLAVVLSTVGVQPVQLARERELAQAIAPTRNAIRPIPMPTLHASDALLATCGF
jgi:endonuclease YncB( thermonuclease family)